MLKFRTLFCQLLDTLNIYLLSTLINSRPIPLYNSHTFLKCCVRDENRYIYIYICIKITERVYIVVINLFSHLILDTVIHCNKNNDYHCDITMILMKSLTVVWCHMTIIQTPGHCFIFGNKHDKRELSLVGWHNTGPSRMTEEWPL